ncbi:MAG: YafY family transcriptional regulator [Verrucomicrobiae bacterium]|nr:YafY family transcriptional regulator [Verrucomicrobiae bacterium]
MNRVDRLLALLLFLQSRRVTTADQMARHFELSLRTIYRDLAALGEIGVPIVAEAGVGYTLRPGFHLPPVNFTAEEANALVTGGMLVGHLTDASVRPQMQSALAKVRAILPREQQDRAIRLERAMTLTATVNAPEQAGLGLLQRALAELRVLQFTYQAPSQSEPTKRTVEPLGLIRYLERWHLIAWCRTRRSLRDFRTDRMDKVTLSSQTFAPKEEFSLRDYVRSMPQPALRARVRFTPSAADRAKREWWPGIVEECPTPGGVILTLAAVEWEPLVGWLLSLGRNASVIAPEALRSSLVEAARHAALHHEQEVEGS